MKPLILINFKNYKEASGKKGISLARRVALVRTDKYEIAVAPSLLMMGEVAKSVKNAGLSIFAQHADSVTYGKFTGSVSVKELRELKANGTLLNHSEKKLSKSALKNTIELCRKNRLKTIVCASNISEIKEVARLHPDFIAYEPKELIGKNMSVTETRPKIITKVVYLVNAISPKTRVLCGAGIHSKADLGHALLLGTSGVLIGHAVPKARNPQKFLEEMLL